MMAMYVPNPLARTLWNEFLERFSLAKQNDTITFVRGVLTIALCWLLVASWICYTMKYARLTTILEEIRTPTRNQENKGIDLFKVISFGTISLDTDLTFGRFLQYNAILALLLCVVRLSGRIQF